MAPDNAPGGTAPMEHPYKSHTVLITCWPTLEPFGFVPEIRINNKHQFVVKTFKFTKKFKTKAEAETYARRCQKNGSTTAIPSFFIRRNRSTKRALEGLSLVKGLVHDRRNFGGSVSLALSLALFIKLRKGDMLNPQKAPKRDALLKRIRELNAEIAQPL